MRKVHLFLSLFLALVTGGATRVMAADTYSPIAVTGFNCRTIVTSKSNYDQYTALDIYNNGGSNAFFFKSVQSNGGIPTNGKVTTVGGKAYQIDTNGWCLQVTTSNNHSGIGKNGTLTFVSPWYCKEVSLLVTGGNGSASFKATINYSDGTTKEQSCSAPDWYTGSYSQSVIRGLGRIRIRTTSNWNAGWIESSNFKLFEVVISADQSKLIKSISFTSTNSNFANIYAVSGVGATKAYTEPKGKTLKYNGSAQTLIDKGSSPIGTMYYRLGTDGSWSTALPTAKNAGDYTIYYYVKANTGYSDVGSESSPIGSVTTTIEKADLTYTAPTPKTGLKYTGSAQVLANAGACAKGTFYYRLGTNGSWSTTVPSATNAGTYTIYYYIKSTDNMYADAGSTSKPLGSIEATIAKVDITTYTAPTAFTPTYNGNYQQLVGAGQATGGTMYYQVGSSSWLTDPKDIKGKDYGTYAVKWYVKGDANHNDLYSTSSPQTVNVTIGKAEYNMSAVTLPAQTFTYDGTEKMLQISGELPSVNLRVHYEGNGRTDAGRQNVTATFTTTDTNYNNPKTKLTAVLTVEKYDLANATAEAIEAVQYTGSQITPTVSSLTLKRDDGSKLTIPAAAYTPTYGTNVNAGSNGGSVTLKPSTADEAKNYTGSKTVYFTIDRRNLYIYAKDQTIVYGGDISSTLNDVVVENAVEGHTVKAVALGTGSTEPSKQSAGTYPGIITIAAGSVLMQGGGADVTANYNIHQNGSTTQTSGLYGTLTVQKKAYDPADISITGIEDEYEYTGNKFEPAVTVRDNGVALSTSDYSVEYGENTKLGKGTVKVTIGVGTNPNYERSEVTKTFDIYYRVTTYPRKSTTYSSDYYNYCTYYNIVNSSGAGENLEVRDADTDVFTVTLDQVASTGEVTLKAVSDKVIKGGQAVMLRTKNAEYAKLYKAETAPTETNFTGNVLVGVASDMTVPTGNDKYFIFNGDEFIWAKSGGTLTAGHAYIKTTAGNSMKLAIRLDPDGTTGIKAIGQSDNFTIGQSDNWYDMQGRKLNGQPRQHGVYIRNGKKIIIR